jgi:aspartate kinase
MTALLVQKFGGSSLATIDHIKRVAAKVLAAVAGGARIVVVTSAMQGETDRLLLLAQGVRGQTMSGGAHLDTLLGTGEQACASLLAMALEDLGVAARIFQGGIAGIMTDYSYQNAHITRVLPTLVERCLEQNVVPIVAGFQGVAPDGTMTTLSRGGSDLTAVALAAALSAHECQIFTDVPGVYSADPHLVAQAKICPRITFAEMLAAADCGAKVLQARAVAYAGCYNVTLRVLAAFGSGDGTLISYEDPTMEQVKVTNISLQEHQAVVRVVLKPGIQVQLWKIFADLSVGIALISQHVLEGGEVQWELNIEARQVPCVRRVLADYVSEHVGCIRFSIEDQLAKVSLIGLGLLAQAQVTASIYALLDEFKVVPYCISTSNVQLTLYLGAASAADILQHLHQHFCASEEEVALL